jgi:hypothetical protein
MYDKKHTISFDLAIQRNANIWDNDRKSLLIHSYIEGYPIPACYAGQNGSIYNMLDGKQRLTSTFGYINDEFTLTNVPMVIIDGQEIDINGKKFSELPEDMQEAIWATMVTVYVFKEATDEQVEEIFFRLNIGISLTKFELTRVKAGHLMEFVKEMIKHDLFNKINFTERQILRYQNEETVLQIINILYSETPDFTGTSIQKYAENFDITEEQKEEIKKIADYVNNTIDTIDAKVYKRFLKKAHVSTIFKITAEIIRGRHVNPEKYKEWLVNFFTEENKQSGSTYNNAVRVGSAKRENIRIRTAEMQKSFNRAFTNEETETENENVAISREE